MPALGRDFDQFPDDILGFFHAELVYFIEDCLGFAEAELGELGEGGGAELGVGVGQERREGLLEARSKRVRAAREIEDGKGAFRGEGSARQC